MSQRFFALPVTTLGLAVLAVTGASQLSAKNKGTRVDPNDVTLRLYQLLDAERGGKLAGFYVLADIYKDQEQSGQEFQHVLRAEYDKDRSFGKLNLYVRSVAKMEPAQLQSYTPKQVYGYGETDLEKFVKTDPGEFGRPGDIYLRGEADIPLTTSPVTEEVRKSYEFFVARYLLPALQKK